MGHSKIDVSEIKDKTLSLSPSMKTAFMVMIALGVLSFALGWFVDKKQVFHSYLVSYFYFASLALGGLFFTAIQHATSAGWSVTVRRIAESFASFVPAALIGGLFVVVGAHSLFEWTHLDVVANDPILRGKQAYLNMTFFIVRLVVFGGGWILFSRKIVGMSLAQDKDGADHWTQSMIRWSVGFLLFFALSYSLFSVDMMMSLQPHWFSTIWGVYCFAGLFQSTFAFMILMALHIRKKEGWHGVITLDHIHDLAKFLKGFTVFWAYIAFSQFMLIWYANLPEETIFYINRSHGGWWMISMALLGFKFVVPFVCLLPRWTKRTPTHLICVCVLVLVMQFVDLYWIVYPNLSTEHLTLGWMEVGIFVGFLGGFLWAIHRFLGRNPLVPAKDPYLEEALSHHVTY